MPRKCMDKFFFFLKRKKLTDAGVSVDKELFAVRVGVKTQNGVDLCVLHNHHTLSITIRRKVIHS